MKTKKSTHIKLFAKAFLVLMGVVIIGGVFANPAHANPTSVGKDWNTSVTNESTDVSSSPLTKDAICAKLFTGDPDNIFRETICSLMSIVALSVTDFATNVSCTVQKFSSTNYDQSIIFHWGAQVGANYLQCNPRNEPTGSTSILGTASNDINVYGVPGPPASGFYASQPSQLSSDLLPPSSSQTIPQQSKWIYNIYNVTRGIMTVLAVVFLFVFAFANILHIDVNTYAIKKALPTVIIAVIGGWLSIYIVFFISRIVDFLYRISIFSPYQALNPIFNIFGSHFVLNGSPGSQQTLALVFSVGSKLIGASADPTFIGGFIGGLLLLIASVTVYAFEFTLALRPFVVGLLTAVAPIAFACMILPQTQAIFKKWWTILFIAILFTPIVNFVFFILNQINIPYTSANPIVFLVSWVLKIGVIIFLIRLPFTIESDYKKLAYAVSKTGFGASIGLSQLAKQVAQKTQNPQVADSALESQAAKKIIASTTRSILPALKQNFRALRPQPMPQDSKNTPNLEGILDQASRANLNRTSDLMIRSAADLSPEAFRKIISNSDLKLWRDENLLSELKNKSGQTLDDSGAALRADSARKIVRLAQAVEQNKIANPDAIKLLAQKGILDTLPVNILKKSLQDGIINKADLMTTFKDQTDRVFEKLQNTAPARQSFLNTKQVRELMDLDRKDNVSGFKDLSKMFSDTVSNPNIIPPPAPAVIRNIVDSMKSSDRNVFDKNGMFFLERLGEINRSSKDTIAATLQKSGVPSQTAASIATNPQLNLEDVKSYAKSENLTGENLGLLREGFLNRDLSNDMTSHIARLISDNKVMISKGITQKLSDSAKLEQGGNLDNVKSALKNAVQKMSGPVSPQEAKDLSLEVDKFYPGATIKAGENLSEEDIGNVKQRAKSILETIDSLQQSGVSQDTLSKEPQKAMEKVEEQVNTTIQKVLSGEVKSDAGFDASLNKIAVKGPEKTGNSPQSAISNNKAAAQGAK
ncbi:MAG: DMT family transporter [Candidatus Berkelbacteria bacterium]|nr:DMT family transporter [Candidatus Berkelbacteria bacterium]